MLLFVQCKLLLNNEATAIYGATLAYDIKTCVYALMPRKENTTEKKRI